MPIKGVDATTAPRRSPCAQPPVATAPQKEDAFAPSTRKSRKAGASDGTAPSRAPAATEKRRGKAARKSVRYLGVDGSAAPADVVVALRSLFAGADAVVDPSAGAAVDVAGPRTSAVAAAVDDVAAV